MTRARNLSLVAIAALATVVMSACTSASDPASSSRDGSSVPAVAESKAALASASPSATSAVRPRLILDGVLKTAVGERVVDDSVTEFESRGAQGWQAATRSASNPISNYRAQLLASGWKFTVDEPARLTAQKKGDWITLTSTNVQSFTGKLPWATVLAYAHFAGEAAEQ